MRMYVGGGIFAIGDPSFRFQVNQLKLGREERVGLGSRGAETQIPWQEGRE